MDPQVTVTVVANNDDKDSTELSASSDQVSIVKQNCDTASKEVFHLSANPQDSQLSENEVIPITSNVLIKRGPPTKKDSLPPAYEETAPTPPSRRNRKNQNGVSTIPDETEMQIETNQTNEIERDIDIDQEEEEETLRPRQYFSTEVIATLVAGFSFLCIGLQRAYTSPAISSMKEDHEFFSSGVSNTMVSWFAASPPLASFFGTIFSGLALQYLGRQKTLLFLTLPYISGWLVIALAKNTPMIIAGRALTGFAVGLSTAAAPMYVSECVRAKVRGFLGFLPPMMLSLGILMGFALSTINIEWQALAMLMTCFPILLFIFAMYVPESPTWLLYRGKEKAAIKSLRRLRGLEAIDVEQLQVQKLNPTLQHLEEEIEKELEEMKRVLRKRHSLPNNVSLSTKRKKSGNDDDLERGAQNHHNHNHSNHQTDETFTEFLLELWGRPEIRFPAFISVSLMIFQQLTGANSVIYYLSVILSEADPTLANVTSINGFQPAKQLKSQLLDPKICSVIFGLVQFFAFFLSLPMIDRLGRRVLLMVSASLMAIPHVILGLYFWVMKYPNTVIQIHVYSWTYGSIIQYTAGWLPLLCLCAFIAGYSIGFGPVPFIIMSEVFPTSSRSWMVALASLVNHLTLFFMVRVFPTFFALGPDFVFWGFSIFCLIALFHVAIFVPETKSKTLAEIELGFKKHAKKTKDSGNCECNCKN